MLKRIAFDGEGGHKVEGDLASPPGDAHAAGVVLVQESWGVNDHVRDVATRLAAEGFRVLAVDLYHGVVTKDPAEAGKMLGALDWGHAVSDIAAAVKHLQEHPSSNGKVAVMGFCMGGALSFAAACNIAGLSAVVPFYGVPQGVDYAKVTAPIMAHFAKVDQWAKPELGQDIQTQITGHGGHMELFVYDEQHAFFNDTRADVYGEASAKLAWQRSIGFLKQHLA